MTEEIEISHAKEFVKCDLCSNIISSERDVNLKHSIKFGEVDICMEAYWNKGCFVCFCPECLAEFVKNIDILETEMNKRTGLYNKVIIIKDKEKTDE